MHDDHGDVRRERHRFDRESIRQSMSSACPARPNNAASWSIRPPGTPVASTSAASARRAASSTNERELAEVGEREGQRHRQRRARRQARTRAAPTTKCRARRRRSMRPAPASTRTAPATKPAPRRARRARGSSCPLAATTTSPASSRERARIAPPCAGRRGDDALEADRHREARSRRCSRCGRPSGSPGRAPGTGSPGEGYEGRAGSDFCRGPGWSILVA